jgi:hypothetical protein
VIDAAAGLQHLTGESWLAEVSQQHRFHERVLRLPGPKST